MFPTSSTANNEHTPLLTDLETPTEESTTYDYTETIKYDVYDRFTPSEKRVIVTIVSLSGLIPCASSVYSYFVITDMRLVYVCMCGVIY